MIRVDGKIPQSFGTGGMTEPKKPSATNTRKAQEPWAVQRDIRSSISEVEKLIRIGVIQSGWPQEVFWPVITRMVICIRDLVAKSERYGQTPIDFTDDVIVAGRVKDAASLIRYMRDALCHVQSPNRSMNVFDETEYLIFTVSRGRDNAIVVQNPKGGPDIEMGCAYGDDMAFLFGSQRVYLRRHLLRAFNEAVRNLQGFLKEDFKNPL